MPFPVEEKYIEETETELDVKFPIKFKKRMLKINGGELVLNQLEFNLYPFFDKSDRKRITRTCNHIGTETKNARQWSGFPENAIAIGNDDFGNFIILTHNGDGILADDIYFWDHETRSMEKMADSINEPLIKKHKSLKTNGEFMIFVVAMWHDKNGQVIDKSFETASIREVLRQMDDYPWQDEVDYFDAHGDACALQFFRENAAHKLEIQLLPDSDNRVYLMAFYDAKNGGFLGFGRKKRNWDNGVISLDEAKTMVQTLCSTPLEQLLELPK